MRVAVLLLLSAAGVGWAAPVPRPPPPDPFGHGYFGVRATSEDALQVETVDPDTPAGRADIRPGDVFVTVGTLAPRSFAELRLYVGNLRPGTRTRVVVRRGGDRLPLTLVVTDRPADAGPFQRTIALPEP
jgi:S1-C subfamily serine protease